MPVLLDAQETGHEPRPYRSVHSFIDQDPAASGAIVFAEYYGYQGARWNDDRSFCSEKTRELFFKIDMEIASAAGYPGSAGTEAVFFEGVSRGLKQTRIGGKTEVIISCEAYQTDACDLVFSVFSRLSGEKWRSRITILSKDWRIL